MRKKLTITLALAAVGCICWFGAGAQTTNTNVIDLTFQHIISVTNWPIVRVPVVTNLVVEAGHFYVQPDYLIKNLLVNPTGRTNIVNVLVASGEFCRVRGHSWGGHTHVTLEFSLSRIGCRQCFICGLHQEQHATEWK